jgi:4-aminobutyrate aminotransferase/(S)-3-amino-2-methylpropionate transaminase
MARRKAAVARGPFHATPVFVASAHGALLTDVDHNILIDLAAGIGVVNTGHTATAVVDAVRDQAARLLHASFNTTPYEAYVALAERLNAAAPGTHAKKTFLANSGAEAVENAVKIARAHTGRAGVLCFEHAFHGRTYMAMTLTGKAKPYKYGFSPLCSDVYRAPYPYAPGGLDAKAAFAAFLEVAQVQTMPSQLAAVIIEPVVGEGGFMPADPAFLRLLRAWCTEHGVVLIADEIQCGFGRTGTLFASEQLGLVPDLLTTAKGLAGGMPLSAVVGRAEMMDAPVEGGIGGTFGGNPVSAAAALAVLDLLEDDAFLARARALGVSMRKTLEGWRRAYAKVGDVRGLGPMLAFELVKAGSGAPDAEAAKALAKWCYERGVVVLTAGSHGNCLRLLPPLVITDAQLAEAFAVMEAGLKEPR